MNYPKKVLLIDDDEEERDILSIVLKECCGWVELLYEKNGEAAMHRICDVQDNLPDMVFLDWFIPQVGGSELLAALRSQPLYSTVPIIIFTGADVQTYRKEAEALGASYFLPKPSNLKEFRSQIEHIFSLNWKKEQPIDGGV